MDKNEEKTFEKRMKDISENFQTQIEKNSQEMKQIADEAHQSTINDCICLIEKDFENALKDCRKYVRIGTCDEKQYIENKLKAGLQEAISKTKEVSNFRFYLMKLNQFHFDFWNYKTVYRIIAVQDDSGIKDFQKTIKPLRARVVKEL